MLKHKRFANGASRTAALAVRSAPASLDEAARSVEFVAATERAVNVFDWERWDIVPEVLLMSGVQLSASGQVPLLDSHERGSVSNVLGSFSSFRVENGQLVGKGRVFGSIGRGAGLPEGARRACDRRFSGLRSTGIHLGGAGRDR